MIKEQTRLQILNVVLEGRLTVSWVLIENCSGDTITYKLKGSLGYRPSATEDTLPPCMANSITSEVIQSSRSLCELEIWRFAEIVKQAVDDNIHSEQGA